MGTSVLTPSAWGHEYRNMKISYTFLSLTMGLKTKQLGAA